MTLELGYRYRLLSHCCDRMPDINNLRKAIFILAHSFRDFSPSWKGGSGRLADIMAGRKQ
jgi:hypothetical protein